MVFWQESYDFLSGHGKKVVIRGTQFFIYLFFLNLMWTEAVQRVFTGKSWLNIQLQVSKMKKNVLKSKTVLHRTSIRFDQIKLIVIHSKTFSHTREIFINCRLIELFFFELTIFKKSNCFISESTYRSLSYNFM